MSHTGTGEPVTNEPGTSEPGAGRPVIDETGAGEPGMSGSGTSEPGAGRPDETGADESGVSRSGAAAAAAGAGVDPAAGARGDYRGVVAGGLGGAAVLAVLVAAWLTAPETVPGIVPAGPLIVYGLPVVRVVLDLAALTVVGLSLLPKLLGFDDPESTEPVLARARRWAVLSALVWTVSALIAVVLSAAELTPGEMPDIATYVGQIGAGQGLLVTAGCALAYVGLGKLAVRFGENVPAELRIAVAIFGLLPIPVTGHASNWYWHDFSMVSMELHVIGAMTWTGGLVALAVLVPRDRLLLARALPRFSKLATVALIVVGASGLFNAGVELLLTPTVAFPASLVTTGYGLLVIAKIVFFCAVALLGARMRWRLLPLVARQAPAAFATWAALEVGVMGLAYGVAVALTRAPVS